jgi:hypothetical protein
MRQTAVLATPAQAHAVMSSLWASCIKPALTAGQRLEVVVREARKSRDQEAKYHAMFEDIARQYTHAGRKWDGDDMKRLLVAAFKHETKDDPDLGPLWKEMGEMELAPAILGGGFVLLGTQTKKFPKKLATALIEWLYAFGAENDICWTDPEERERLALSAA